MTDAGSHAVHLAELAAAQRDNASLLAAAVADASAAGLTWQAIGEALGIPGVTAFRQHKAGSPVSVLRPFHSAESPRAVTV
jgi:uncharacterized protein with LGFP repeats